MSVRGAAHPQVVGGRDAPKGRFKYQVGLRVGCGGSLIRADVVLTAAHCMTRGLKPLDTFVGAYDYYYDSKDNAVYKAYDYVIHPDYDDATTQNDVALVFLKQCVMLGEEAQLVKIATKEELQAALASTWQVSGWGTTSQGALADGSDGDSPEVLQYGYARYVPTAKCAAKLDDIDPQVSLCAGLVPSVDGNEPPFQDSCQGDSGGPLTFNVAQAADPVLGDYQDDRQIGVVSWGEGCGLSYPGVYTNIPYFRDWVIAEMAKMPPAPCPGDSASPVKVVSDRYSWSGDPTKTTPAGTNQPEAFAKCQKACGRASRKGQCEAFSLNYSLSTGPPARRKYLCDMFAQVPARVCSAGEQASHCGLLSAGAFQLK